MSFSKALFAQLQAWVQLDQALPVAPSKMRRTLIILPLQDSSVGIISRTCEA